MRSLRLIVIVALLLGTVAAVVFFALSPPNRFGKDFYGRDKQSNYALFEYSYNVLQSCLPNAILFTNGNSDTSPLWYLQKQMGIRTDISIINLSLADSAWYLLRLKNDTADGAEKVPISWTDQELKNVKPMEWQTQTVRVPVPPQVYKEFGITDTSITDKGYIQFTMQPSLQTRDVQAIRVQDLLIRNIVETNQWKRPIYFAVSVTPDNFSGLSRCTQMQGLALRLMPLESAGMAEDYTINEKIMAQCFLHQPSKPYVSPHYGFLFTNLNDPNIHFDDNVRNIVLKYRYGFIRLAAYYEAHRDSANAIATLNTMESDIPMEVLPMNYVELSDVARMYLGVGDRTDYKKYAAIVEREALAAIKDNPKDVQSYYNPYRILLDIYDQDREYQKAIDLLERLQAMFPNEKGISEHIAQLQALRNAAPHSDSTLKVPATKRK